MTMALTRYHTSAIALVGMFALIGFDLWNSPPNPYQAPSIIAFGSGVAGAGGFCGSLPN